MLLESSQHLSTLKSNIGLNAGWDGRRLQFIANLMKVPRNFIPGTFDAEIKQLLPNSFHLLLEAS